MRTVPQRTLMARRMRGVMAWRKAATQPVSERNHRPDAWLSVSWLWLSVRWKDERYREAFIHVRGALALGDDFRGIFRFVARADAAPFVNHMALFVCQRLLGPLGARRSVQCVCHGRRDATWPPDFMINIEFQCHCITAGDRI